MEEISKRHETPTDVAVGLLHKIGDFNIIFDEETNKLKIYTFHGSKHLKVRPKADNCIEVEACR